MPFESEKQKKYLYANKPEVAEKFEKHEAREEKKEGKERMRSLIRKIANRMKNKS